MKIKKIAVCASAYHYGKLEAIDRELQKLGFEVILPKTARKMIKSGDFDVSKVRVWLKDPNKFDVKNDLMTSHFKEVEKADAILVANFEKNGIKGYVGGNVLMEITLAFYLKKPIYILNKVLKKLSIYEEIYGVNPVFLNGNLSNIKAYKK